MSVEENKNLIRRYTGGLFDEGNVAAVDEYLAPDFYTTLPARAGPTTSSGSLGTSDGR